MFFLTKHKIFKKYKEYRETGKILNQKIIDRYVDREILSLSGKYLGLIKKGVFIFDDESDTVSLMDFAINECRINGKKAVGLYKEKVRIDNAIEAEILNGLIKSITSLFKIVIVKRGEKKLILADVLNNIDPIEIIDIGFSQTAIPGTLIFLRIIPFADFDISGGIGFPFHGISEEILLKEYRQITKRVKSSEESIKRYVAFFKLYKRYGLQIGFL